MAFDDPIISLFLLLVIVGVVALVLRIRRGVSPRLSARGSSNSRKFCFNCGSDIPRVANFCPACGQRQEPQP